jgi:intracellular multiplication protein IcmN
LKSLRDCLLEKSTRSIILLAMVFMSGCQPRVARPIDDTIRLPTHVAGTSDAVTKAYEKRLAREGVQIISEGQDYLLIVPSRLLFPDQSPQLTVNSYAVLNDLACYLKEFRKINVNVTAFGSQYVSIQREHALTLTRARAVSDYLWSQGIDSRFIFTQGHGRDKPQSAFAPRNDRANISRVEITFRNAVA